VEQGIFNIVGIQIRADALGAYSRYAGPIITHQAMGGMIVLVLFGLWNARRHLADVFRKAFTGDADIDDSDEMLSYRQAVFGLGVSLAVMAGWLHLAGVPLMILPVLFFGCFVVFVTITRIVVQGGVAIMIPPMVGADFVASAIGTSSLGMKGAAGLATTYVWGTDLLILLMAGAGNGMRLMELVRRHRRRVFWTMLGAAVVAVTLALWLRLTAGYQYGAINLTEYYADRAAQNPYRFMEKVFIDPLGPNIDGWIHMGIGALIMLGLETLHLRVLWWPFHPLGFPISSAFGGMWFSVLIAFVVKSLVLSQGGPPLFRKTVPFFLGLILGDIVPAGFWLIIDGFTGMHGNVLGTFLL
jgi:hypothetical protein